MIATSDWLVRIMLGPQWGGTSKIVVVMGLGFLFQPITNTGGWLLVSQGRAKEMLTWSLLSAPFSILAIVIGLRWGALGVAASYSVARLFVINPLMFWFIGRSGPIRTSDFWRILAPFILSALAVIAGCLLFRQFVVITNPLFGLMACAVVGGLSALVALIAIPGGRAAIMDIKHSIRLLKPERRQPEHA